MNAMTSLRLASHLPTAGGLIHVSELTARTMDRLADISLQRGHHAEAERLCTRKSLLLGWVREHENGAQEPPVPGHAGGRA